MLIGAALLLGLLVGSFLNVVIWRVPRGQSVVTPASACPGCSHPIRPRDNVPVASWVLLRGRCRDCSTAISARYPAVELLTGALFAVVAWRFGLSPELPAYLYLAAVGLALALIDLDTRRLPDVLTLPSYPVGTALLAVASRHEPSALLRATLGTAAMLAVYFALVVAHPAGMGLGDLKLSGVLGLYTGWLGWDVWAAGLFLGFLLGGIAGVVVLLTKRGGRKTAIPFGPFMLAGALVAVLFGQAMVSGYLSATTGG